MPGPYRTVTLDATARSRDEECDKAAWGHDYLRHYEVHLKPLRKTGFSLLEIGTWKGAGLRLWATWCPAARIIGIDRAPHEVVNEPPARRGKIGKGSIETIVTDFHDYSPKYPFDVIIDDGSHQPKEVVEAVDRFWPHLNPGGIYFIEDWQVQPALGQARQLADNIMHALLEGAYQDVDALHAYPKLLVLQKKG